MTRSKEKTMDKDKNYRMERIERLLHELEYEVTRGVMEKEIDERIGFRFVVPVSRNIQHGVVLCEFRTRPAAHYEIDFDNAPPRLKVIK